MHFVLSLSRVRFRLTLFSLWPALVFLLGFIGHPPAEAARFTIDGITRLNSLAIPTEGEHHFRFSGAGYLNPGSLTLVNNGSDSLIFERAVPTDSALQIDSLLLHLQGFKGKVVFRGLALKLNAGGALFDTNQSGNHDLVFDSCTVLGDAATQGKVFAWGGDGSSTLVLSNSIFAYTGSISLAGAVAITVSNSMFIATGSLTLAGATDASMVSLANNLFNFSGVVSVSASTRFEMRQNTVNRTQFLLDGNFNASCDIRNNYFANPPARNNLAQGGTKRYVAFFKGGSFQTTLTTVSGNIRYGTWDGFEYVPTGGFTMFSDPTNIHDIPSASAKDSTVLWDWKVAGDSLHGAWNGPKPLPDFNVAPGETSLTRTLPGGQAVFRIVPSPFPRRINVSLGTVSYATSIHDSVRSWFRKDTSLVLTGALATVTALALPPRTDPGTLLVYARTPAGFDPVASNPANGGAFPAPLPQAREFVPAYSGQNTFRGSNVIVTGPAPAGPTLVFPAITRAGTTVFRPTDSIPSEKRLRRIRSRNQDPAFAAASNAEGGDTVGFGIPKTGLPAAYAPDSLRFWLGGKEYVRAQDSAGMFWGKTLWSRGILAMLVERLAFGPGQDSLLLGAVKLISNSTAGHQLSIDSGYRPSQAEFPDKGVFGQALAFTWPGRADGDKLFATFPRVDSLQKAYFQDGTRAPAVDSADAHSLTVALSLGDSGKPVFLAREYMIASGALDSFYLGPDYIAGLFATKPGNLELDSAYRPDELDTVTGNLHVLSTRGIKMDSLRLRGSFNLLIQSKPPVHKDSVKAFALQNAVWRSVPVTEAGGRYAFSVDSATRAVALAEALRKEAQSPAQPAQSAIPAFRGDTLILVPQLTDSERAALPYYRAELISLNPDGIPQIAKTDFSSVGNPLTLGLDADRLYAYRVIYKNGSERLSPDTAWIPLTGRQPSLAALQKAIPIRSAKIKYLIGFPSDATFADNLKAGFVGGTVGKATLSALSPQGQWNPILTDGKASLKRGEGYLFAATTDFSPVPSPTGLQGLRADTVALSDSGWHLFSNPLPTALPLASIQIESTAVSLPRSLKRLTGTTPIYEWPFADTLRPFEGYLIYVYRDTRLVFDPLAAANARLAKSASPGRGNAPSSALRLTLSTPIGPQSAVLYRNGPYLPTPYMPPLREDGKVPWFRVGGDRGWACRKVERIDSVALEVEITVPEKGAYALSLATTGDERATRLLDLQSGKVLDEAGMGSLYLDPGTYAFTLLHGKAVEPGIAAFARSLPADFSLDQNFPNPFRANTRVRFRIPAQGRGPIRGELRVTSLEGRLMAERALGTMTVGEHSLSVGDASWKPGVYVYELRLLMGNETVSLRKKMVCGGH